MIASTVRGRYDGLLHAAQRCGESVHAATGSEKHFVNGFALVRRSSQSRDYKESVAVATLDVSRRNSRPQRAGLFQRPLERRLHFGVEAVLAGLGVIAQVLSALLRYLFDFGLGCLTRFRPAIDLLL